MVTSRTPVSKKTATKKVSSTALPSSTAKSTSKATTKTTAKAAPKALAKTPAAAVSVPKTTRAKQEKLPLDAVVASKPRATKKVAEKNTVSAEQRYQMIAAAAYFLAERHGFNSDHALDDWIAAEKEIDSKLNS